MNTSRRVSAIVACATTLLAACARENMPTAITTARRSADATTDQTFAGPSMVEVAASGGASAVRVGPDARLGAATNLRPGNHASATVTVDNAKSTFISSIHVVDDGDFEGITSGFQQEPTPWLYHGVSYTSGDNLVIAPYTGYYANTRSVACYNLWTPMRGSFDPAAHYSAVGFDLTVLGYWSGTTLTLTSNKRTYTYSVNAPAAPNTAFFGYKTDEAGEYFTGFVLSSAGGGSAPCLDEVVVGIADLTPPVVTPHVDGTLGSNGWYTSNVNVSWTEEDAESPITSTSGCDAVDVTTDTDGQTFTCSATSAGGTTHQPVTIKRDATNPVVTYTGNAGSYTVDRDVAITCLATDATSGVDTSDCHDITAPAYTFAIGSANSFSATARDRAGNTGVGSTSFTVSVTTASLCALTQRWSSNAGVASSMCAKLSAAQAAVDRGNTKAAQNQIGAYVNEVRAQSGKAITAESAAMLTTLAADL